MLGGRSDHCVRASALHGTSAAAVALDASGGSTTAHPALGAWLRRPRNLDALPALLFERGLAVPLGEPFKPPAGPPPDDLADVVARIRALVAGAD